MQVLDLLSLTPRSVVFSVLFYTSVLFFISTSFCLLSSFLSSAPSCVCQSGHSALPSFQFHVFFSFPESYQITVHLLSSHHPLSSFISALIPTIPPLKSSQQSISSHLLLGKIFLWWVYILFFWLSFDLYFLFFHGIFELMP